jgi:hypothetical protein
VRFESWPEFFGPHAGRAGEVKPVGRVALAERIRQRLAEAELALGDAPAATSTLRSSAQRWLDHIRQLGFPPLIGLGLRELYGVQREGAR